MNKRKRNVIDKSTELFIQKGYHGTSIQDILNHSGISKGSFYNYFPSKGELFLEVFDLMQDNMTIKRDELLIGEDITDQAVFLKQVNFMITYNRKNRMLQLIEDVFVSNEPELIKHVKKSRYTFVNWVYERFVSIFPKSQEKYMMDCAVLYTGMMQNVLDINHTLNDRITVEQITIYCLDRMIVLLNDVSEKDLQLFDAEKMMQLIPRSKYSSFFNNEFATVTLTIKRIIEEHFSPNDPKRKTCIDLLHFIQKELMNDKEKPRKYLIESALTTLNAVNELANSKAYLQYKQALANMNYHPIV